MRRRNQDKQAKQPSQGNPIPRLPLLFVISGGILILLAAIAVIQLSKPGTVLEQKGSPTLIVDIEEINLGDVPLGEYVQASFQLTNTGTQALIFNEAPYIEVKEGC